MFEVDLHRLAVFCSVVDEGSLSKASEHLFMSQPAISAHIKALELLLGLSLFNRDGRRSVVNRAGEALYTKSRELFLVADELKVEIDNLRGIRMGRLTLGACVDWQYRVPMALDRFKRMYSDVRVSVEIAPSDRVEKLVLNHSADIGFVGRPSSRSELISKQLASDELVPICSTAHRLAKLKNVDAGELAGESLIVREPGSATRRITDDLLGAHHLDGNISMELGSYEPIKRAVMAGMGMALVPRQALEPELRAGLLAVADVPQLVSPLRLSLIYHKHKKLTSTKAAFLEMITSKGALSG